MEFINLEYTFINLEFIIYILKILSRVCMHVKFRGYIYRGKLKDSAVSAADQSEPVSGVVREGQGVT